MNVDIAGAQIQGAREMQEDSMLVAELSTSAGQSFLGLVADGVGGYGQGDLASRLTARAFGGYLAHYHQQWAAESTADYETRIRGVLRGALDYANRCIKTAKTRTPAHNTMATTLIAALVYENRLWWVSVGDSHLYLLRQQGLKKINQLHTYGAYLDEQQRLGKSVQMQPGATRKMLTSAIEGRNIALVDCALQPVTLEEGDTLVVASDGLDILSAGQIVYEASGGANAREGVERLLRAVQGYRHSGQDNASVIVARLGQQSADSSAKQPADPDLLDLDWTETLNFANKPQGV